MVCLSVCLSATLVSPAKTAEPIEMPSGLRTWLGPRDHVLDGVQIPMGRGKFWGENRRPIVKYRDFLPCSRAGNGSWVMGQMGHENRTGHMGHGSLGVDP